ncbi:hypothetical protein, partial [Cloacibacillus evryensis]|uniref:hypothetical protein n=1 Tax=Cloacibacillus evryensis TaxID=508460 RepID=UPI002420497C
KWLATPRLLSCVPASAKEVVIFSELISAAARISRERAFDVLTWAVRLQASLMLTKNAYGACCFQGGGERKE